MRLVSTLTVLLLLLHANCSFSLRFNSGVLGAHDDSNANTSSMRCIGRERQALLAVKQGLVDILDRLSSWGTEAGKQDCCKWKGVYCDAQTGHVIKLDLGMYPLVETVYSYSPMLGNNISSQLIELQHLEYLDLYGHDFNLVQIPNFIGSMSNLRYLNLSKSRFGGQIPFQLGNLSQLEYLDLSCSGELYAESLTWLRRLYSLKYLDLGNVELSNVSNWLETINQLPKLRYLRLSDCGLPPPFLSTFSPINSSKSLASVHLSDNYHVVTPSLFKWLGKYHVNLAHLDLHGAQYSGSIPDVFENMSSLTDLDLSFNQLVGGIPPSFAKLCSLQNLMLYDNKLNGQFSMFVQILSTCAQNSSSNHAKFSSLRQLFLSGNQLSGRVPESIGKMSSLEVLYLSENGLSGRIPESIGKMFSLKQLFLSGNQLSGQIPESIGNMSSLEVLDLSENRLTGRIPEGVGHMSLLEVLDLSKNGLSGRIPKSIGKMFSLKQLFLSGNQLSGRVPESIGQMSSLEVLDLSKNGLSGRIPESIGQLSKLEAIYLGMNSLEGVVSETHFSKLSKLQTLDLSSNSLVLTIPSDWVPPFHLDYIKLGSCKIGPNFPAWLQTQKNSSYLDISNAEISDILPSWFWSLGLEWSFLDLSHNQIQGTFANLTLEFASGFTLNLSSNHFEGPVSSFLSSASYLDLSDNKISGSISFLCERTAASGLGLTFLNLSTNNVSGEIPDCWTTQLEDLVMLDLSYNAFSGKIPITIGSLNEIKTLKLRGNRLVGALPSSLKNCTSLEVIDLSYNKLSSSIPEWLGVSFPNLVILMLQANNFNGSMPSELCHLSLIRNLDFSMNKISGSIPKCLNNLTTLAEKGNSNATITHPYTGVVSSDGEVEDLGDTYEDDASFIWKGRLYAYKKTLGLVKRIDFSSNRLTGEIPSEISHLVGLVSLNLSRNNLTGHIIPEIGKLQSLDSLDLSRNQIDGNIPASLARVDRLGVLDLSYNNLSGEIPIGTQLQSLDSSVYAGNPQLCGLPLPKMCGPEKTDTEKTVFNHQEDKDELITQGFYISMGLGFIVGFWGVCCSLVLNRSWRHAYFKFLNVFNDWLYVRVALIRHQLKRG